ncbi:uncharacterized protein C8R40DRAFT_1175511 [Lentinula edodes]|uniref:uncharacterized protein n=1 Tax=Lentinula edodes TaxID=5353 RepID=UPI001E8D661D|nr:uncharacterized protein C8R40DRAFT_1175511 [Lentinula edodes]KAH7870487.1 hypothetical protein C8R40DRAFT_1175511 [Lentinula edodes]
MSTFLSIPNNLDTLALSSASSSSISSSTSTSSLFDNSCLFSSSSSQTDISPPTSPLNEDEEEDSPDKRKLLVEYDESWESSCKGRLKTPTLNASNASLPVPQHSQGLLKVESPAAAADEAGYEAEESDGEESVARFILLKNKKKKLSLKQEESELSILLSPAMTENIGQNLGLNPLTKPVLRPQFLDLNSPSPIVALPSPRSSSDPIPHLFWDIYPSSSSSSVDAISSPIVNINDRIHRGTVLRKTTQKPLGLGLRLPGKSGPCSRNSAPSIEIIRPLHSSDQTAKEKGLVGLGLKLPLGSPPASPSDSSSSFKPVSAKRRSLSGLGNGHPSTRNRGPSARVNNGGATSVTTVPSSEATIRLVTSTQHGSGSILLPKMSAQVLGQAPGVASGLAAELLDVVTIHQRRTSICLKPLLSSKDHHFTKRHMYPILESPESCTNFTTIPTTSASTIYPALNLTSPPSSQLRKLRSFSRSENVGVNTCSNMSSSFRRSSSLCSFQRSPRSPLQQLVDRGSEELWQPAPQKDPYLIAHNMIARTLF